ncbi:PREDICTED: odorant receptor 22c-like [Ceratosolen solmsi marchali]|uniref:Odorant receptor n=1 Tax=Ceratosolen solmsi marchali TaxID=326594 RepID=A0AAJ6YD87_9HYME|nr:PREDICTED: odorant receptor 22c-like [Ceratosolen solmsi marchali]
MKIIKWDRHDKLNQKVFDEARILILWNKYLMSTLGLWPNNKSDLIFVSLFCYLCYAFILNYIALYYALKSLNLVNIIGTTVESITLLQICIRLYTMRRYNKYYGTLLNQFLLDFSIKNYKNDEERSMFLSYNVRSKFFIKIGVVSIVLTAMLYFTKPLIRQLHFTKNFNSTVTINYDLPYRIHILYKVTNIKRYIITYISQIPLLFIIIFTQTSMDCLTLSIILHLCGQLGVLSIRINNLNVMNEMKEFRQIIQRHQELIIIGLKLKAVYRLCLFVHFIGASVGICILIYQVQLNVSYGQMTNLLTFFGYGFLNTFRLYTHCWVGEYLIHESVNISNAFYQCQWYDLPIKDQKSIIFCITCSQQPLSLVAGSFGDFSFTMFTNIMKSAMAYLSFLRNFI